MKNLRLAKNVTAQYSSFEELAKAFNVSTRKQTKDKEKLTKQRETFCGKHICRACKQPMVYIGGNQMCCTNEACKGIKHEIVNEETGEKKVWFTPSFDLLDEKGSTIAENIFS